MENTNKSKKVPIKVVVDVDSIKKVDIKGD